MSEGTIRTQAGKSYSGNRTDDGTAWTHLHHYITETLELPDRLDLRNHSPTGFEWGYEGSGPAQLALAILADVVGPELALKHYQRFKREVVAKFDRDEWYIDDFTVEKQIQDWEQNKEEN